MNALDLLMIKIGAMHHVQDAVAADLKAEIRADVIALINQGISGRLVGPINQPSNT